MKIVCIVEEKKKLALQLGAQILRTTTTMATVVHKIVETRYTMVSIKIVHIVERRRKK